MSVSVDIPVRGSKTPKRVRVTPDQSRYLQKVLKGRTCHEVILSVSLSRKSGTLSLVTIPRWENHDSRDIFRQGRSYTLEVDPDGQWFYPGLRNRDGKSHSLTDSVVKTPKTPKRSKGSKTPKTPSSDPVT